MGTLWKEAMTQHIAEDVMPLFIGTIFVFAQPV
jgi:hypothetical protein